MAGRTSTHRGTAQPRRFLAIALLCLLAFAVRPLKADEIVDTGWLSFTPAQLDEVREFERLTFQGGTIDERRSMQTSALNVIQVKMTFTNKTEKSIFFDLSIIGEDAEGEELFIFNLSPALHKIPAKKSASLTQSRYVVPGTLDRVAIYRARFVGFK